MKSEKYNDGDRWFQRIDDHELSESNDDRLEDYKNFTGKICDSLLEKTYEPNCTIELLLNNMRSKKEVKRLFYSEISVRIFTCDNDNKITTFTTNAKTLFEVLISKDDLTHRGIKCTKEEYDRLIDIATKIFDHSYLAQSQSKNFDNEEDIENIRRDIGNAKDDMSVLQEDVKEARSILKKQETQHVTILGIFASVVMAFFGGLGFSSSVLANIHQSSIYRIVFITSILAFALTTAIYFLIRFIASINDKEFHVPEYWFMVCILFAIVVSDGLAWYIIERPSINGDIPGTHFYRYITLSL